jgi:hypothetical protein
MITTRHSNNGFILLGIFAALWIGGWVFDEIDFQPNKRDIPIFSGVYADKSKNAFGFC